MIEVFPLKYGPIFKKVFSHPHIFQQFASDILDLSVNIERVETEYQYPEPVGFVRSRYDLFAEDTTQRIVIEIQQVKEPDFFERFLYYHLTSMIEQVRSYDAYWFTKAVYTIVVLTSTPKDGSVNFSCAINDQNLVDEFGIIHNIYPHRLIFLAPRQVNDKTPPKVREWLQLIEDSLDGKMDESRYERPLFRDIISQIHHASISPELLAEIKNDAVWEIAKHDFITQSFAAGAKQGRRASLCKILQHRFGVLSEDVQARIDAADGATLDAWLERALVVDQVAQLWNITI